MERDIYWRAQIYVHMYTYVMFFDIIIRNNPVMVTVVVCLQGLGLGLYNTSVGHTRGVS